MTWPLLTLISVFTVSIATLLERILMKEDHSNPVSYAIVFQIILGTIALIIAIALGKFSVPNSNDNLIHLSISAGLWAGMTVFNFYAIKLLTAGEVTIIGTTSTIFAMTLGLLILNETLTSNMLLGTLLIAISIWLLYNQQSKFTSSKGIIFALISAACSGIAVVNDAILLQTFDAYTYTVVMSFLPAVVLILLFPRKSTQVKPLMQTHTLKVMCVFCLFYAIQAITYYLAYEFGAPISKLSPITKSSIILTVILAAIFLNERDQFHKKIISAMLVTIGVLLIG